MKKILIVSLSAGSGHVRAADALKKTADKTFSKKIEVHHVDFKQFVLLPIKKTIIDTYSTLVRQAPQVWGVLFDKTNSPMISKQIKKLSKALEKINTNNFLKFIENEQSDYVIFTHFFPADIYASLRQSHPELPPFGVVVTDYGLHELWITQGVQDYFVATKEMAWKLEKRNIAKKSIHVTGIPVDPAFLTKSIKKANTDTKHIVLLSGGSGLTNLTKILNILKNHSGKLTITAIAGKNEKLKKSLKEVILPTHIKLKVIGWTDTIETYIKTADVVIGKCGGLTTTECMVTGTPLIAINPIPGQEEMNAKFILENDLGHVAHTPEDILFYLNNLKTPEYKKPPASAESILRYVLRDDLSPKA